MVRDSLLALRLHSFRLSRPETGPRAEAATKVPKWKVALASTVSAASLFSIGSSVASPQSVPVPSSHGPYTTSVAATFAALSPLVDLNGFSATQARELAGATGEPGVLGESQALRAVNIYQELPPSQESTFQAALGLEPDAAHRVFVWKDLGAGQSPTNVVQFAQAIRPLSDASLVDQLTLGDAPRHGTGLAQQWEDACVEATLETALGDLNPAYALEVHQKDRDVHAFDVSGSGLDTNPFIAAEQRDWLNGVGGDARLRGQGGSGTLDSKITELFRSLRGDSGYAYDYTDISPSDTSAATLALDAMARQLRFGVETPFRVTDKQGSGGHFAMMLSVRGEGDGQVFTYHDPWSGDTGTATRADFLQHTFNIAGWDHLGGYASPTSVDPDALQIPASS